MRIQLFCEHSQPGNFTALDKIIAHPQLLDTSEWIDLENRELLPPYGAMEVVWGDDSDRWFAHGAEDMEVYAGFLIASLYGTLPGGIPSHKRDFLAPESLFGFDNVIAKIYLQPGDYWLLQVQDAHVTLITVAKTGEMQSREVLIGTWREAAEAALQSFARFYQQVVLPAFLSSPLKEELYYGLGALSADVVWLLGEDYRFSQPHS